MTITLLFLAVLMFAIVGWLLRQSVNVQPWVAQSGAQDVHAGVLAQPAAKTALWVFLAVATSLFALFISAYAMRIGYMDWTPLPQPQLLALNTTLLILASGAVEWAAFAARRGDAATVRKALAATGTLTLGFIAGQLVVWQQLADAGYFLSSSAATGFFYLLTAVHGLHVLGGLVAFSRPAARAWRDEAGPKLRLGVELCAIYWHFLLAAWVVLFAVLTSNALGLSVCSTSVTL
jgi:cytochrome c oxidase subunit 3